MAAPRRTSRSYRTDLRAKQSAATRTAIVAALTAELARSHETGEELSLARVATAAGVSLRTVYHHFPDRASQLAAVGHHLDATLPPDPHPTSLGDLPTHAARIAYQMLASPQALRAEVALDKQRRARDAAIHRAVAKQGDAATAKLVGAAVATVLSPEVALALLDRHRLDAAAAETTITWMVQVLVDAVRNGDVPASPLKRTRRS
jgi:AcrR family transcriptional regulator